MSNYVNVTYVPDCNGSSDLHIAAEAGHVDIVDRLLRVRSSDNTIGKWCVTTENLIAYNEILIYFGAIPSI